MQKSLYPTWYEFKKDLQKEVGRSILNQEWLQLKPKDPLPWNDSSFQTVLLNLTRKKSQFPEDIFRSVSIRLIKTKKEYVLLNKPR